MWWGAGELLYDVAEVVLVDVVHRRLIIGIVLLILLILIWLILLKLILLILLRLLRWVVVVVSAVVKGMRVEGGVGGFGDLVRESVKMPQWVVVVVVAGIVAAGDGGCCGGGGRSGVGG